MKLFNKIILKIITPLAKLGKKIVIKTAILVALAFLVFGVVLNEKHLEKELIVDSEVQKSLTGEDKEFQEKLKEVIEFQVELKSEITEVVLSLIWMGEGRKNYPLKVGQSFWVSGTCLNEDSKLVKLFDDQVTIRNFNKKDFKGLIRESFQEVSCTRKGVNLRPVRVDELVAVNKLISHPFQKLKNSIVLVTGVCSQKGKNVLLEETVVDVFSIQENEEGKAVLIGLDRSEKAQVKCLDGKIRFSLIDSESARNMMERKEALSSTPEKEYVYVSGVCKREISDEKGNKIIKSYSLLNEPIKVMGIKGAIKSPDAVKGLFVRGEMKAKEVLCEDSVDNIVKIVWASSEEVLNLIQK